MRWPPEPTHTCATFTHDAGKHASSPITFTYDAGRK